ncbi:S8 family serine peptidase [Mesorhizobium yinganensis]|uniref:S8 family serine peptidase n=1 Tax=Mesorhizobium yinganensis TaxID=3157707 RepID=UPI0032B76615
MTRNFPHGGAAVLTPADGDDEFVFRQGFLDALLNGSFGGYEVIVGETEEREGDAVETGASGLALAATGQAGAFDALDKSDGGEQVTARGFIAGAEAPTGGASVVFGAASSASTISSRAAAGTGAGQAGSGETLVVVNSGAAGGILPGVSGGLDGMQPGTAGGDVFGAAVNGALTFGADKHGFTVRTALNADFGSAAGLSFAGKHEDAAPAIPATTGTVAATDLVADTPASALFAAVASKLGGDLTHLALGIPFAQDHSFLGRQSAQDAGFAGVSATVPQMTIVDGMVAIDVSSANGDIAGLLHQLEALGLQHGSTWGNLLSGLLPVDALAEASQLANLNQARAAMAFGNVGAVTSQGDASMHSDDARAAFGLDGSGVTVGIMSDSFNNLGGAATGIASGDLPASGVLVLKDLASGGADEGRAMAEIVHDVAPGAALQFRTAFLGQADFANGIQDLITAGSDVVVDDVGYFAEPFFQDGVIAQSADLAFTRGAAYYSAAGNSADDSYQATFVDSGKTISYTNNNAVAITNAHLHDFDAGAGVDTTQSFTFAGTTATGGDTNHLLLSFQWDEPFSSVSAGKGAVSDYDVLLTDNNGNIINSVIAASSVVGGDAVEIFDVTYTGADPTQMNISIARASGSTANLLKTVIYTDTGFTLDEFDTQSSTNAGHANAAIAQGVAAAFFGDTPEFGLDPAVSEWFSSLGGTPILFDTAGNRLPTPLVRAGPDITAPDGADTTFFGGDTDDAGAFPNFFGTSAAAPHAAAVAALLMQRNPNASIDDIYDTIRLTAHDMGGAGDGQLSGAGLIDANAALAALNLDDRLVGDSLANSLDGLLGNDRLFGLGGADTLDGGKGIDILEGGAGDDKLIVDDAADVIVETAGNGSADRVMARVSYVLAADDDIELLTTTSSSGSTAINLTGNALKQEIIGNAGVNILADGGGAGDLLRGLGGNDVYIVRSAATVIVETSTQGTADRVSAAVDYGLGAGVRVEQITTTASSGTSGIDLTGNEIAQSMTGNAGSNIVDGKGGNDTLTGLGGKDFFVFSSALGASNVDKITDFNVADDTIQLENAVFTALTSTGVLAAALFKDNFLAPIDADDRIIYNSNSGSLFYDADGAGGAAAVKFATLSTGLALTAADFVVI